MKDSIKMGVILGKRISSMITDFGEDNSLDFAESDVEAEVEELTKDTKHVRDGDLRVV